MMPKKQFESWFRSQIYLVTDEGRCKKFVLRHVTSASRMGQAVLTIDVPSEVAGEEGIEDAWISESCRSIEDTAQGDADGAGGMNNYIVQSFHGEKPEKATARFTLKFHGGSDVETDEVSSEPPNKTGLLSQLMRHNEAIMRTATIVQGNALSTMQRTQARQESIIEGLLKEKFENFELIEKLLSQKDEREMAKAKAIQDMEMRDKLVDKVSLLAPMVINKFMSSGKPGEQKLLPEATTPVEQQLSSLADSIDENQLMQMQKIFSPEQLMTFVDVFSTIKKKQNTLLQKTEESK